MGLLDIFRRDDSEEPVTETEPVVDDVLLKALLNDEVITREKALTLPAVSGAVDFITNCVAAMPVRLYKITEGKVEEVIGDVRTQLLNGDTGDTLDAFQLKKAMTADYLLGKGGYCYIQKSRNDVTGLFYVDESSIEIMKTVDPIYKSYDILVLGAKYRPYDFIKLLRNTKDGASGTGLVGEVSKVLETAYQTLLYQLGLVKTGGSKKGFLKSVRKLGQDEINRLKKAWHNLYSNNEENVVVLNNGLEFQEASASSVEMQLNESKRTMQDEINNLFHISSDFDATFKFAVYPILKAFETALNRDLLLEKEKADYFFEFDVKELTKASLQERYAAYKLAKETGFLTINEIRKAENMNYIEGMDVINVGLGSVLYDIDTHKYYTPNTDTTSDPNDDSNGGVPTEENAPVPEDEELEDADRELEERFNPNHDAKTGRFASKSGVGVVVKQDGSDATIPAVLEGNFDDFEKLDLSESEKEIFLNLHKESQRDGLEHGIIILPNGITRDGEESKENGVKLPLESIDEKGLKLYHSHTNDTLPSTSDLKKLLSDKVSQIGVITRNGDVFTVEIGNGWRPTKQEFDDAVKKIQTDIDMDLPRINGFLDMSIGERSYMSIREKAYRISRYFDWRMRGGKVDE